MSNPTGLLGCDNIKKFQHEATPSYGPVIVTTGYITKLVFHKREECAEENELRYTAMDYKHPNQFSQVGYQFWRTIYITVGNSVKYSIPFIRLQLF